MTVDTQLLGNTSDFGAKMREFRDYQVPNRYRMLDLAAKLLPDRPVDYCMKVNAPNKKIEVWQDVKTEAAHLKGVFRCGKVWICPVCGSKIAIHRRGEIEDDFG